MTGQQIPRKYLPSLGNIPRKHTKVDPYNTSEHSPTREIVTSEISLKIVNVIYCLLIFCFCN